MSSERLSVVLAEYQALRNEINMKLPMVYQIYTIYFAALGFFYGYVFANKIVDLVLAIPSVALALFYRLLYDQRMIRLIDKYIVTSLSKEQLPQIIATTSDESSRNLPDVMQWIQYYNSNAPPRYYKSSMFIIFVILSVVPPIAYNIVTITAHCTETKLPIWVHLTSLIVNLGIGFWIAYKIVKEDF